MTQIEKNSRIREKCKETRAKRKDQTAKVYEIKFDKNKISKQRSYAFQRLFLEGKWFTNYIISKGITEFEKNYIIWKVIIDVSALSNLISF